LFSSETIFVKNWSTNHMNS